MPRLKHPVKFICKREFGIYLVKIKFHELITHDLIFELMSKLLGTKFITGSYCASRLLPGVPVKNYT